MKRGVWRERHGPGSENWTGTGFFCMCNTSSVLIFNNLIAEKTNVKDNSTFQMLLIVTIYQ